MASVTNPYRSTSDPTYGVTQYGYDPLGRSTSVTYADGSKATTSYSGNCATSTDPAGKARELCSNALGEVTEVIEDPGNLHYVTNYTYGALGNLVSVNDGGQTRTYTYDMLSRLISATTPESGTTTYSYLSSNVPCSGDPSDVCVRTRPTANQTNPSVTTTTTYAYDALNRLTSKSYSDGTPTAQFGYDQTSTLIGTTRFSVPFGKGRLSWTYVQYTAGAVMDAYNYDSMGRVIGYYQDTPYNSSGPAWQTSYNYDLAGDVASWTHPAGFTITNTISTAQQITQITSSLVDANHPQYLAKSIAYTPWGAESTLENGCASSAGQEQGCTATLETYVYNNRMQPVMIELGNTSNASADYCLVYNYYASVGSPSTCATPTQGTGDNGDVMGFLYQDSVNPSLGHTEAYSYDGVNRLETAVSTGNLTYNLNFTYDRYGNMECNQQPSSGYCGQWGRNSANNQLTGAGVSYDAAGDMTGDGTYTYQYDAEGRVTKTMQGSSTNTEFVYNAAGQAVGETWPVYNNYAQTGLFSPAGRELGYYNDSGGGWYDRDIWAAGRMVAQSYPANTYFLHANALHSDTQVSDQSGVVQTDFAYYPWQIWKYAGTQVDAHFAGFQQSQGPNYPTPTRTYSGNLGRWLSPDPLGGDITNPQSLNRYAYVLNNPTTLTDPLGLQSEDCSAPGVICRTVNAAADGCEPGAQCVTVYGGPPPSVWLTLFADFYLSSWPNIPINFPHIGPSGGTRPAPPPSTGFTLGLRVPNQTFNQCMTQNATNYSAGGAVDLALGLNNFGRSSVGQFVAGNTFTGAYAGLFGSSLPSFAGAGVANTPDAFSAAIGSPLSYGRRTADIFALNLEGKGGLPLALSPVPATTEIKSALGSASRLFNLGVDATTKGAIDAGLFGAEVIGCAISR